MLKLVRRGISYQLLTFQNTDGIQRNIFTNRIGSASASKCRLIVMPHRERQGTVFPAELESHAQGRNVREVQEMGL